MSQSTYIQNEVQDFVFIKKNRILGAILSVLMGIIALTISSKISIPLQPIPVTFQTLVVVFIGVLQGWRLGLATVLAYLTLGAIGVPVFASSVIGLAALLGPTGGFLLGFIPAVIVAGFGALHKWIQSYLKMFICAFLSFSCIYFFGILGLLRYMDFYHAIQIGLMPFLTIALLKIIAISVTIPYWHIRRYQSNPVN